MLIGRKDELEILLSEIRKPHSDEDAARIITMSGLFGVGKSTLIRSLIDELKNKQLVSALLFSNEDAHVQYLPEFIYQLINSFRACKPNVSRFRSDETDATWIRFSELNGTLKSKNEEVWRSLSARSELRSTGEMMEYVPTPVSSKKSVTSFDSTIRNTFKSSEDQRLLIDTGNVVCEAMVVDLMNTFYPIHDGITTLSDYLHGNEPIKIAIIIDTYEKISGTLNQWMLESFLPYCYTKRFGDFRTYNSPYLPPSMYVSQFFDFRVIIAGREPIAQTDAERRWDRWRSITRNIELDVFSLLEVKQYLAKEGIESKDKVNVEEVLKLTNGLPYLVALWTDVYRSRRTGADEHYLSSLAQERVFWYKTEEQKEWIRISAFCDSFDSDILRCFPATHTKFREAFNYLRHSSELTSLDKSGRISLHPIIQKAIRNATEQESVSKAQEYNTIANTYFTTQKLLGEYNIALREAIRLSAYFDHIDLTRPLPEFMNDSLSVLPNLFQNERLFVKNKHTYSLIPSYKDALTSFNKYYDGEGFDNNITILRALWKERKESLQVERNALTKGIEKEQSLLQTLQAELEEKRALFTASQTRCLSYDSELVSLKKRGQYRLSSKDIAASRLSFVIMVITALIGFYSQDIMDLLDNIPDEMVSSFQKVFYSFSAIFCLLTIVFVLRAITIRNKRKEMEEQRATVELVEEKSIKERTLLQQLTKERDIISKEAELCKQRVIELADQNVRIQEVLAEPYI
jgi:GTPase SAR1 family protein